MRKTVMAALMALTVAEARAASLYVAGRGSYDYFGAFDDSYTLNSIAKLDDKRAGWGLGAAAGVVQDFGLFDIRIEGEYYYRNLNEFTYSDATGSYARDFYAHSLMANAYVDVDVPFLPSLYAMAGGGVDLIKKTIETAGAPTRKDDETRPAWAVGGGMSFGLPLTGLNFDLGYRRVDLGEIGDHRVTVDEILGGVRFRF